METLQDDFNDNSFNTIKWTRTNDTQVVENNSSLEMSSDLAGNYVAVDSVSYYDLTGSHILLELADAGNQALTSWETYPLTLIMTGGNYVQFRLIGGLLKVYKKIGASATQLGSTITYDSAIHKWLRIREHNGTMYFDWSTDGINWTNITSVLNPITVSSLQVELSVGTWQAEATTTTMIIDNINYVPYVRNDIDKNNKKYFAKVYTPNNKYITSWNDFSFDGFNMQLNGGLGECALKLARNFDDFGEGEDVVLNNKVEIWVSDKDTPSTGQRIYSGYISTYEPYMEGKNEGVDIKLLSYTTKLATSIFRSGTTLVLSYTATGISTIVRDIIDKYRANSTNPKINYTSASVSSTGVNVAYNFKSMTYFDALEKCRELAPADYWWFVDADNLLTFSSEAAQPKHRFIVGKDFTRIRVVKNMENVFNNIIVSNEGNNTQILKRYQDTTSKNSYDDRWAILTDSEINDTTTADSKGNAYLNEHKDADIAVEVEIIDNNGSNFGYDIESIKPGDTCKFMGFNSVTSRTFSGLSLIKQVQYYPDRAVITLETAQESIARSQAKDAKKVKSISLSDIPLDFSDSTSYRKNTAYVATAQTTTSASYTDLATVGPSVTVNIGTSGMCLVILQAELWSEADGDVARMSFAASGANTVVAGDAQSRCNNTAQLDQGASVFLLTGLNSGSTTFIAKYRRVTGTGHFQYRRISVIPV